MRNGTELMANGNKIVQGYPDVYHVFIKTRYGHRRSTDSPFKTIYEARRFANKGVVHLEQHTLSQCCGTTCDVRANKDYVAKLEAMLDDVYNYGKKNPTTAPNCVMAVVDSLDEGGN